jgi:hypothetical protein
MAIPRNGVRRIVAPEGAGSSSVGFTFPIKPGFAAGSSRPEQGSLLVLASRSGFKCGQSGVVLLTSALVTTVTTLWKGVLDLWSGHARLLPCLWYEPKGVLRICGDSGDGHDAHDGPFTGLF